MSALGVLPSRPVDYFIVITTRSPTSRQASLPPSPLNDTGTHSNTEVQPGAQSHSLFKPHPAITQRFPLADHADAEFPKDVTMFAFPSLKFELNTKPRARETFSFVLTEADGARVYATALRWWDVADPELVAAHMEQKSRRNSLVTKLSDDTKTDANTATVTPVQPLPTLYAPTCLILTSHWPFLTQMERYLLSLHTYVYSTSQTPGLPFPIERSLINLINETPLPPQGQLEVQCQPLPSLSLTFARPPPNKFPLQDFSLVTLFRYLSVDNVLTVFSAASTEKRILFTSHTLAKLTLASECLLSLLFPFYWRNIYIPILPQQLLEFSAAPMPFVMGVPTQYLPEDELLDNALIVDLDNNRVRWNAGSDGSTVPPLPSLRGSALSKGMKKLLGTDGLTPVKTVTNIDETELHAQFVRFYAKLFQSYRDYLQPPNDYVVDKFDRAGFLAHHDEKSSMFLTEMLETQMFTSFIDDRYHDNRSQHDVAPSTSAADAYNHCSNLDVLIFDEFIDRESNKSTPFLTDTSQEHNPHRRYSTPIPYHEDLVPSVFTYQKFPFFNPSFFYTARLPPLLATPTVNNSQHSQASLSLQFFTHKRAYSQYFHALRLRSSKYDMLMKDVNRFMHESAVTEEDGRDRFNNLCHSIIDRAGVEFHGATIDTAWSQLKRYVGDENQIENDIFAFLREESFIPLTTTTSASEHQLKLLFTEATALEAKAAKLKSASERSKAKATQLRNKFTVAKAALLNENPTLPANAGTFNPQSVPTTPNVSQSIGQSPSAPVVLSGGPIMPPLALNQLIGLWNDAEEAALTEDEDEAAFQTMVGDYEARMPELVKSIKQLNFDRLATFKQSMKKLCQARRSQLETLLTNLAALENSVEEINVERDVKLLSDGSNDLIDNFIGGGIKNASTSKSDTVSAVNAVNGVNGLNGENSKSFSASADDANPLSRPDSPVNGSIETSIVKNANARNDRLVGSDALMPEQSQTFTATVSPPSEIATASTTTSTNAGLPPIVPAANRKERPTLTVLQQPLSPVSAPTDRLGSKIAGRVRALSSVSPASQSQPSSPVLDSSIRSGRHSPHPSLPSALPSMFNRSSPKLQSLKSAHSLQSLFGSSTHSLSSLALDGKGQSAPQSQMSSVGQTFLAQLQRQHAIEDLRDRDRARMRSKLVSEWKNKGLSHLSELEPCYALNLWGDHPGFDTALAQATSNKRAVKEFTIELEQWQQTIEMKRKRFETILSQQPRSIANGTSQLALWESFKGKLYSTIKGLSDYLDTINQCTAELKLNKGEIKNAITRSVNHKQKLERDYQSAVEEVNRAATKRGRAWQTLQSLEQSLASLFPANINQRQLESHAANIDRAIKDFKEADHEWLLTEREKLSIEKKNDQCKARILAILESKDKQTGLVFKKILTRLADSYGIQCISEWKRADDSLLVAIKATNIGNDWYELIVSTYDIGTPANKKIAPNVAIDFSRHLSHLTDHGFTLADTNLTKSLEGMRVLSELMGLVAECEDSDSKLLKRSMAPVKSAKNTTLVLALSTFEAWLLQQVELCEEHAKLLRDCQSSIDKLRSALRLTQRNSEKSMQELERSFKRVDDEFNRASIEEKRIEDIYNSTKAKVKKAESDATQGAATQSRGFLSSFTSTSLDALKSKALTAEADYNRAKSLALSKKNALKEEWSKRESGLTSLLQEFQQCEINKITELSKVLERLASRHRLWCDRAILYAGQYRSKVSQIDVVSDCMDFLAKNSSGVPPPMLVIEQELKRVNKEKFEHEQKQQELERSKKQHESLREQSKTRKVLSVTGTDAGGGESGQDNEHSDSSRTVTVHRLPDNTSTTATTTTTITNQTSNVGSEESSTPAVTAPRAQPPIPPKRPQSIVHFPQTQPSATSPTSSQSQATPAGTGTPPVTRAGHVRSASSSDLPPLPPPRPNRPNSGGRLSLSQVSSPDLSANRTSEQPHVSPISNNRDSTSSNASANTSIDTSSDNPLDLEAPTSSHVPSSHALLSMPSITESPAASAESSPVIAPVAHPQEPASPALIQLHNEPASPAVVHVSDEPTSPLFEHNMHDDAQDGDGVEVMDLSGDDDVTNVERSASVTRHDDDDSEQSLSEHRGHHE